MAPRAKTAERQATYRKAGPMAGENGERRISTWVPTGAVLALNRLARRHVTQQDTLERLITAADDDIVAALDPAAPE